MLRRIDEPFARLAGRLGIHPLTLSVGLFVLCFGIVLNVALNVVFGVQTTLRSTLDFFTMDMGNNSWWPIRAASHVINIAPQMPVYTTTVFGLESKFQYPPTSLLLVQPILVVEDMIHRLAAVFKLTCWGVTLATVILMAWMFPRCLAAGVGRGIDLGRRDLTVLAAIAVVATLTFNPLVWALSLGQIQTWINFMFCAAAFAWVSGRKDLAGVLIAAICLIKPQLTLFILWAIVRKEWRFVWFFAAPFCLVSAVSVFVYGLEDYSDYFSLLAYVSKRGECFFPNQSVNGLLNRLLHNGDNLVWQESAYAPYNFWIYVATSVSSAIIIAVAILWRRHENQRASGIDFLVAGLSFTMASPIAWVHHYGVMLPMFAIALPATIAASGLGAGSVVVLAVSYVLSGTLFDIANRLADTPFNFAQSYMFFGAIVLLVHLYRLRHAQYMARGAPARELVEARTAALGA